MERNMTENFSRSASGCLSVPLFNQKKRSRFPLTSMPSESDCGSSYSSLHSYKLPSLPSGNAGYSQVPNVNHSMATHRNAWSKQGFLGSRHEEIFAQKTELAGSHMGEQTSARLQNSSVSLSTKAKSFSRGGSTQSRPKPPSTFPQIEDTFYCQAKSPACLRPQQHKPQAPTTQPNNVIWKFKSPSCSSLRKDEQVNKASINNSITPKKKSADFVSKQAQENSLRFVTAVIEGMKHWSLYKDKTPLLFEVFGSLDSAVTLGNHGAKTFLLRDGRDVVQCVFYETDKELPRLIRGQVHRCVGNYSRDQDLLTCMSVRQATPLEQRNAQEAVRASDTEMRKLVRGFAEV